MKKYILFLFCSLCSVYVAFAQKTTFKAIVKDSLNGEPLSFAAATLLNAADSQLVQVNYSEDNGSVELSVSKSGTYYYSVSYLSYETQSKKLFIQNEDLGKTMDLGTFRMAKKSAVLSELTVKSDIVAIALKGDTVEYNSKAFQTRPNASAEELLKKLPGMEVEKDGSIKAQGESVNRVLVDGKPFFGDDPKMATKNLPADAIDKIQVYDSKSEQSQFTGINDGSQGKIIDLKLKSGKKTGYFGKIVGAYGSDERFNSAANYFNFSPKKQISVLGAGNNINTSSFTVQDVYGDLRGGGAGNMNINTGSDDVNASLLGGQRDGINTVFSVGTNFRTELKAKTKISGSYFYNQTKQEQIRNTSRTYQLTELAQNEQLTLKDTRNTQRVNFEIEHSFSKKTSLKITPALVLQSKESESLQSTESLRKGKSLNQQLRDFSSENKSFSLKGNAIFRHKFAKEGRTFSLSSNFNLSDGNGTDFNNVTLSDSVRRDTLRQRWQSESATQSLPVSISYTEPITRKWKLETSYLYGKWLNENNRDVNLYNTDNQDYTNFDSKVSAHLQSTNQQHRATARLQYEKLRYTLTMEGAYEFYPRKNVSELNNVEINQTFKYFLPTVRFQYSLPRKMRWGMNYTTSVNYPTINQLISAPDNSNPLRVQLGNLDLLPSYTHSFQMNLHKFNTEKNKFVHAFARFALPQNAFSTATNFDNIGRQTSQTINVDGNYTLNSYFGIGFPVKKLKFNIDGNVRSNKRIALINNLKSATYTTNLGSNFKLNYDPSENIDIVFNSGLGYNIGKNSLNSQQNTNYYNWDTGLEMTLQLPFGFELSNDVTFNRFYGLSSGFNRYFTLWNASIAKSFLKDKTLEIKLLAFDILKQNQGVSRDITAQYIEDTRAKNLTQYFLVQATYFLNKAGRPDPKQEGRRSEFRSRN